MPKTAGPGGGGHFPEEKDRPGPDGEMAAWAGRLAREISGAVGRSLAGRDGAAVVFSGGIDSSLIAMLAARSGTGLRLYTVGLPGAPDLAASVRAAGMLGLGDRHAVLELGSADVLGAAGRIQALFPEATLLQVSFLAPAFIVYSTAREGLVLTGDGADELFGGYHRYLAMGPEELAAALEKDARELVTGGFERNLELAAQDGKELSLLARRTRSPEQVCHQQRAGQGRAEVVGKPIEELRQRRLAPPLEAHVADDGEGSRARQRQDPNLGCRGCRLTRQPDVHAAWPAVLKSPSGCFLALLGYRPLKLLRGGGGRVRLEVAAGPVALNQKQGVGENA